MSNKQSLSPEQDRAANPAENVWVQANAGTGKTSVLVQRLLRILFRNSPSLAKPLWPTEVDGIVETPALCALRSATSKTGILCLTYTNAGASEMRNRILAALRDWAMADDARLRDMLVGISENTSPNDTDLGRARAIFYTYIDNPDILKIKTIHGFCEEILRRFPMEAGVSPAWNLVSDSNQKILLADAFHRLINTPDTGAGQSGQIADAFAHIVERISEHSFDELLGSLTTQYRQFFQVNSVSSYRKYFIDTIRYFLNLDLPVQTDISTEKLQNIIKSTQDDINSSKKPAAYLLNIVNLTKQFIDKTIDFEEYKNAYLTASDAKIVNIGKKDYLADEQDRVHRLNQRRLDEQIFADTVALFDLSAAFAKTYKDIKAERNLLDFDDLILYTRKLFSKPDSMGWVLSQLDLSLSHILVDEAQDTSPEQWDILRMLSGDFFVAGDTRGAARSLFVVGDTKQSIYGFQGADPSAFSDSREQIAAQIRNNLRVIAEIPLTQSFRSTESILRAVDHFFENPNIRDFAGFINNDHKCFRKDAPGLVEIHKLVSKESD
ncbi:MAG: UvrD-helicase domain-containing protein [Rickettsiales bacterium]|jgi:ATP-dependent helicase/nuclease subunit A|nr:UvrD-helicase domain-containing protein [Rickettsiales bacterium]